MPPPPTHQHKLMASGADKVLLDNGKLAATGLKVDKVLELVGAQTVKDSLQCTAHGGMVCFTGILSGWIVPDFYPIDDIPTGVYLSAFHSDSINAHSISKLFNFIEQHHITPEPPICFALSQIAQAHRLMESNQAMGKIVILNPHEAMNVE